MTKPVRTLAAVSEKPPVRAVSREEIESQLAEVRAEREKAVTTMNEATANVHRCNGAEVILTQMLTRLETPKEEVK